MHPSSCRKNKVRPCVPAVMQISSPYLLLMHHGLKIGDAICLSAAIALNSSLTHVDLSDNALGDDGAAALAQAFLHNTSIEKVLLGSTKMAWKGGEAWGKTLETNRSIKHLEMPQNRISDRACGRVIAALRNNANIHTLNLSDNQLGSRVAAELARVLAKNHTLTHLDLSWNHLRPADLKVLSPGLLSNKTLKTLSLSWNGIGDKTVDPPADVSLEQTQKSTSMAKTSPARPATAGKDAGESLVQIIQKNVSITDLDVSSCRLGSHLCKDLARAISQNKNIQYLLLDGNPFGDGAVDILKAIKARMFEGSMQKFSMDNCSFDPTERNIDFDPQTPNGFYRLDLGDPKERAIAKKRGLSEKGWLLVSKYLRLPTDPITKQCSRRPRQEKIKILFAMRGWTVNASSCLVLFLSAATMAIGRAGKFPSTEFWRSTLRL